MTYYRFGGLILILGLLFAPVLAAQSIDFLDADGNVTAEVLEGSFARLRLTSPADNLDPGTAETVNVQVTSLYGADLQLTGLTETGNDTGVFEGGIQLASPSKAGLLTSNSGSPDYFPDQVTADYGGGAATATVTTRGSLVFLVNDFGEVTSSYGWGEKIRPRLVDYNLNDPLVIDTAFVEVDSLSSGDSELVTVTETGYDTGVFEGLISPILFPLVLGDGELTSAVGETVQATAWHWNDPGLETAQALLTSSAAYFVDEAGQRSDSYPESSTAYLRVMDAFANNVAAVDMITVTVSSSLAGDVETLVLTETGVSTGVFEGSIPLDVQSATTENGFLSTSESAGPPQLFDTLTATYDDVSGSTSTATAMTRGSRVTFLDGDGHEVTAYAYGSTVYVRIEDFTRNSDPLSHEWTDVEIVSASGDGEVFLIVETGMDTGIFEGSLPLGGGSPVMGNGVLEASTGDLIEARHYDFFGYTQGTDQALIQDAAVYFIDESGVVTPELLEGDLARVRLLSFFDNFDPFFPDQVTVEIASLYGADMQLVLLTETGDDTAVFEGSIQLVSPWKAGLLTSNSGFPDYLPDRVTARWGPAGEVSTTAVTRGSRVYLIDEYGQVTSTYGLGAEIRVRLVDHNQNEPLTLDSTLVQIDALDSGDSETVTVTETGYDTGVFEGSIPPGGGPLVPGNGELYTPLGERIEATAWHWNDPGSEKAQAVITGSSVYFIDAAGQVSASYQEGSTAYVRVFDIYANTNGSVADVVAVTLESFLAGDTETLLLTETGPATRIFEGSIPLDVQGATTENGVLSTSESAGPPHLFDTLTVTYDDVLGTTSTATATTRGSRVTFLDAYGNEVSTYAYASTVYVRIEDPARNFDPSSYEWTDVQIVSPSGDDEVFLLLETGTDTGIFEGSLPLGGGVPVPGDGVLFAVWGDLIEARHEDFFYYTQATDQALVQDAALFFIDESGVVTSEILEGGLARVRLISFFDNFDPFFPDQVTVEITSLYGADMQLVLLTETGEDTGVFEGSIQLASPWKAGLLTSNSGFPDYLPDQVTVKWGPGGEVSATAWTRGSRVYLIDEFGQVTSSYALAETIRVRLVDHNQNEPLTLDSTLVEIGSLGAGDRETVTVTETGYDTGIFEGSVLPTPDPPTLWNGQLTVSLGETVEAMSWHWNDPGLETAQAVITGSSVIFVDAAGQVSASYQEGSTAYVRVFDIFANQLSFAVETVVVTLSSFLGSDVETLLLTETGPDTAVFEGSIPLDVQSATAEDGVLSTSETGGPPHRFDTLTATYGDVSGSTSTATATTRGSRVTFVDAYGNEVTAYAFGSTVYIRIEEPARNFDPSSYEWTDVQIVSPSGDDEAFLILETGMDTGIFEGSLPLDGGAPVPGDGLLQAFWGDLIEARHEDFFLYTQATDQALIQDAAIFFIDESGVVTSELLEGGLARVRLISLFDNFDPFFPDQATVEITSLYGADMQFVLLTETGEDTGVFEGSIQLASPWKAGFFTSNSGFPDYLPDPVTVRWGPGGEVSATAWTRGSRVYLVDEFGQVTSSYALGETIRVRLVDHNQNEPLTLDSTLVQVDSLGAGDSETVMVTETGYDTGIFEGSVPSTLDPTTVWNDQLTVSVGETVAAMSWHWNDPGLETAQAVVTGSSVTFVDEAGQVSASYQEGSTAYVRVFDVYANFSPFAADVVGVTLSSFLAGDFEPFILTETGANTGVFEGSIPLDVQFAVTENGVLSTSESAGPPHQFDTLTATYDDVSGSTSTATAKTRGSRVLFLDADGNEVAVYAADTTAYVRIEDPTQNFDPFGYEWAVVEILCPASGDSEAFLILETGFNTGVFEGSLLITTDGPVLGDGVLQALTGELIEARHDDFFLYTQATDQALIQDAVIFFIDESGAATTEILEGGPARIRLLSPGDNVDPGNPDGVMVEVSSFYGFDMAFPILTETGNDTGVFEGSVQLASIWKPGLFTSNSGFPDFLPDEVVVQWDPGGLVSSSAWTRAARLFFVDDFGRTTSSYALGERIHVRAVDHNLNDPLTIDTPLVQVDSSLGSGDLEDVMLTETGFDTGVYEGWVASTQNPVVAWNGELTASLGETIQSVWWHWNDPGSELVQAVIKDAAVYFLDAAGEWTDSYQEGSTAYVRVVDAQADGDPFSAGTVGVTVSSFLAGDFETFTLTETGPATGVFEGSIPLTILISVADDGVLSTTEYFGPPLVFDTLTAIYDSALGTLSQATATTRGSNVVFHDAYGNDATAFAIDTSALFRIEDPAQNFDPLLVDMVSVELVSLTSGDSELFPLIPETGPDTGIFEGAVPLGGGPVSPGDGILQVVEGELIEVRHDDAFGFSQAKDQALIQAAVIYFIDENAAVTSQLLEGGIARVRLLSPGNNLDPGSPDMVSVQIESFYTGDFQLMLLTETGADTGVFEGMIQLASPWKAGLFTSNSGAPEFLPDLVTVQWDPGGLVSATATTLGALADFVDDLGFPVTVYNASPARLRVVDHNLNDPAMVDSIFEWVTSSSGDTESVFLSETGLDTGAFTAALPLSDTDAVSDNGILGAAAGDTIQFQHFHFNDPGASTATATISGNLCFVSHNPVAGLWEMISLPCDVGVDDSIDAVFGDDLDPLDYGVRWGVFERDEVAQANNLLGLTDPLHEGEGYWFKTLDPGQTLTVAGKPGSVVDVPLVADPVDGVQNLVGHPFDFDVCWADVTVVDGVAVLSLDEADPLIGMVRACDMVPPDPSCVISRVGRRWNGAAYDPFDGVTMGMQGTLEPFDGVWVEAFKPGVALRIPESPGTGCTYCNPQPVAGAGADLAICAGGSVTLGTPALAGHTYSWSPGGQTTAQITVSPAATITYTLTATTLCGTAQDSVTVTVSAGGGGFSESFESGASGWTVAGATNLWHLADGSACFSPALGYTSPTHSFYYGRDVTCNFSTGARNSGTLTSPPFTVDSVSALTFQYLRSAETGGTWDETEIFVIDGATVTALPEITGNAASWTTYGPRSLSTWAGKTIQLRFSFDTNDGVNNNGHGWMIDDVAVSGCAPPLAGFAASGPSPPVFGPQPWLIRLAAESGDLHDPDNVFGQLDDALDGYDYHDVPELEPFGDSFLSVVFPHDDWGERSGDYASDFRALGPPAGTWRLDVLGHALDGPVTLRWTAEGVEPHDVTLVDQVSGAVTQVTSGGSYTFTMSGERHPFLWVDELCTGDDASGDADLDGICGNLDNCPAAANADQVDGDLDGVGDACDLCWGADTSGDADGDGACADVDCDDTDPAVRADCGGAVDDAVFSDGFESGGTSAWSSRIGG